MSQSRAFWLWFGLMPAFFFSGGCNNTDDARSSYLLDVKRTGKASGVYRDTILAVKEFDVSPRFRDKALVYRTGKFKYESDYYNEFLTWPGKLVGEEARQWLGASGMFGSVVKYGDVSNPTHVLKGDVTELYGDFSEESNPRAVIGIKFLLVDVTGRKPEIVFEKSYDAVIGLESKSAEELIEAQNENLREILSSLENDLRAVVGG